MKRGEKYLSAGFLILWVVIAFQSCNHRVTSGDIIVVANQDNYLLLDRFSNSKITSFGDASDAIQHAIDILPSKGGSVTLSTGEFHLAKPMHLKSRVTFAGGGPSTRLILTQTHSTGIGIVCDSLNRTVISDMTLLATKQDSSGVTGIDLNHCGDCLVKDVQTIGFKQYGILLRNRSFLCEIRGCRAADCGTSGVCLKNLDSKGRGGDWVPNLVTNCIVYGGGAGIECDRALVANFIGCEIYQSSGPGLLVHNRSNSVLLSSNRTFQIQNDAVVIDDSHEVNVSGNMLSWHEGHGILMKDVIWGSVSGNNIIDSGSKNFWTDKYKDDIEGHLLKKVPADLDREESMKYGIWLSGHSQGITISANAIFNWGNVLPMKAGILEEASSSYNMVYGNTINYCDDELVVVQGEHSVAENNVGLGTESFIKASQSQNLHIFNTDKIKSFIEDIRN